MSKKIFKLSLIIAVLALVVSGCTLPWKKKAPSGVATTTDQIVTEETVLSTNQLKKFASNDELKTFLIENKSAALQNFSSTVLEKPAIELFAKPTSEADIIKTDGTYIYSLVKNDLKITKVNPASDATVIATLTFKSRPSDLIIDGSNLAVFGADDQGTFFKVYDLVNPSDPKLVRDLNFSGKYVNIHLSGDYAFLFTNSLASYGEDGLLLQEVSEGGTALPSTCTDAGKCFAPDVYYFDIPYASYSFANVTAVNLKDSNEALSGQAYLLDRGQSLFLAQNNFYITGTESQGERDLEQAVKKELIFPKLSADDQDKITKISASPNFILNTNEKKIKVGIIIDSYFNNLSVDDRAALQSSIDANLMEKINADTGALEKTFIHKLAFNGKNVDYKGMGEVNGQILSPLSLDENGDNLRLVTMRSPLLSRLSDKPEQSSNNIYVLGGDMKTVGNLENLATNEKIYEARFVGDRAYLITLKQADPLYVIGLSDPTKPEVLGAIKVPVYSSYLYPVDKNGNKLISFGRDTSVNDDGTIKDLGLKIAIFDFSDLTKPKEIDSYSLGEEGSDSIALRDHDSLLYSQEKNLLSVPAVLRTSGKINFAGAIVFDIVSDKFVFKGKVDHSGGGGFSNSDSWNGYDYYDNTVKRSLNINDNLFTFSNNFLKINSLSGLSPVKSLTLTSGANDYTITPAKPETPATSTLPGEEAIQTPATSTPPLEPSAPATSTSTTGTSTNPL